MSEWEDITVPERSMDPIYFRIYPKHVMGFDEVSTRDDSPCGIVRFDNYFHFLKTRWFKHDGKWLLKNKIELLEIPEPEYGTDQAFDLFPEFSPGARPVYDRWMAYLSNNIWAMVVFMTACVTSVIIGIADIADYDITILQVLGILSIVKACITIMWWKYGE